MKDALMAIAKKSGVLVEPPAAKPHGDRAMQEIKPVWQFACEDEIRGPATWSNGILYVGSYDNNLYALDADTGQFIWKYPTDGGIVSKPAVYENCVYFGSEDKRLHVISARHGKITWSYYTEGPVRSSPHIAEGHVFHRLGRRAIARRQYHERAARLDDRYRLTDPFHAHCLARPGVFRNGEWRALLRGFPQHN